MVQSLQQHAESYWTSLAPALDWNRTARREQGEMFLRNTIIPRRDEVVQFVKQVNALDERSLDAAEERIQVVQARFQSRVGAISILALALGIFWRSWWCATRSVLESKPTLVSTRCWPRGRTCGGFRTGW